MIGFVLTGGGNMGSVQAGMLQALLDQDIRPDVITGSSIGAANAAFIASDPSAVTARRLAWIWANVPPSRVMPLGMWRTPLSILKNRSLFSADSFRSLAGLKIPYDNIEDAAIPLRITATRFRDGEPVIFDRGPVVDAILASTAMPGVFAPHFVDGEYYLDGAITHLIPIRPAIDLGARTIYVLHASKSEIPCQAGHGRGAVRRSIQILLTQRWRVEEELLRQEFPGVEVIHLHAPVTPVTLRESKRAAQLVDAGFQAALHQLNGVKSPARNETPRSLGAFRSSGSPTFSAGGPGSV